MTIKSHSMGHEIENIDKSWVYSDTKESVDIRRPCARCNNMPTKEGYDSCMGHLNGIKSACCGHGTTQSIMEFNDFIKTNQSAIMIINPSWLEYLLNLFSQGYIGEIWEEIQDTKINHCKEIERVGYGVINLLDLTISGVEDGNQTST